MGNGILYIALPLAGIIAAPFLRNAFEMRKDKNHREMAGSIFWAAIPFGVVSLIWVATEGSIMRGQNVTLGFIGAVIGASALIWGGYLVRDWGDQAQAQTSPSQPPAVPPAPPVFLRVGPDASIDGLKLQNNEVRGGGLIDNQGRITNGEASGNKVDLNPVVRK